ncbi:hypothetical protein L204_101779 [Cryptococcus depauperatus]
MAAVTQALPLPPSALNNSIPRPSSSASNTKPNITEPSASPNKPVSTGVNGVKDTLGKNTVLVVDEPTPEGQERKESPAVESRPNENHAVERPPIRPNVGGQGRSRFDAEPNPFEQSFSHPPKSGGNPQANSSDPSNTDQNTPPRGTDATSTRHNALPPLSSLTSPAAADPSQFPWLANSLRSGPLSPAILTGPQSQTVGNNSVKPEGETSGPYEGTLRTGFTPGIGFSSTPGYSSYISASLNQLPFPSPNTAAFLNSITNVTPSAAEDSEISQAAQSASAPGPVAHTQGQPNHPPSAIPPHMQQHSHHSHPQPSHGPPEDVQETITPNTLNALTGVFGDMPRQAGAGQGQGYFASALGGAHPSVLAGVGVGQNVGNVSGVGGYVDYAQHSANAASQAANGLFLLSQAHQELSKREEASSTPPSSATRRSVSKPAKSSSVSGANGLAGGKRKAPEQGKSQTKKGKKGGKVMQESSSDSEESGYGGMTSQGNNGKPETEEEKRKNFLERNRQAALKCRQRKKAWLQELQTKVETLTLENERLQQTVQQMHDEVNRLTAILMQHRDGGCGLGLPPGGHAGSVGIGGGVYGRPLR